MTLTKVVLLLAFLAASASSSPLLRRELSKIEPTSRIDGDYRLPNNTKPISYIVRLIPYIVMDNFTFDGEAEIFFEVLVPTFTITLHTNALTYDELLTTLVSQDGISQNVTSHTYLTDLHFLIVRVQDELAVGNYTLSFSFSGILADDRNGFYRSSYTNQLGDTIWLATTHFEATNARRAFPCYDEPALKATFDIAIKHEPEYHALSNMPIAQTYTDTADGKVWTVFETSPIMSTYLVAFVVSDFSAIKSSDESYNVWSRPNAISESQYAYDIGSLALAELEDFTNITYSLRKMDQISIPNYSGGMENWGLIVYGEDAFHYNENSSTLATKQGIATVISHELSHQWFGNLVSIAWWKYLWLKEGLASYFEYLSTDATQDNWRLMDQFTVTELQSTFIFDSSASSSAMNRDVASPDEIRLKFDSISYSKAACVIRMMSHFLTEDIFKAGLIKYLNANAFGAAVPDDLFEALQEAESEADILPAHVNVKDVMDTWVEQSGFPVVTVTRNYTTGTAEIIQQRFLSGDADAADDHDYKWWIPINWASQASPDFNSTVATNWIRSQDESIMIDSLDGTGWVIFNKQQTGYYRVNYDKTNWGMIGSYLNSNDYLNIHVLNRAALIDDAINLAKADRLSYSVVLDLIRYLHREDDYVPWYSAIVGLMYLDGLLANTNTYESFRTYRAVLTSNIFGSMGIEETDDDNHITRLNRANVIGFACHSGLEICKSSTNAKLVSWLDDSTASPISPALQMNMICAGLRSANATTWNKALERYLTSESATERFSLIAGLGCAEDESIINTWLKAIINPTTGITTPDSLDAIGYVIEGNAYNVDRVFEFVINNLNSIISYFGGTSEVQSIVLRIGFRTTTDAQLEKLKTFVAAHSTIVGAIGTTAVSSAESNIAWNSAHQEEINAWIVAWLTNLEGTSTTQEYDKTTIEGEKTTANGHYTTIPEYEDNSTETYDTTTAESSTATAYQSFFVVIAVVLCVLKMN